MDVIEAAASGNIALLLAAIVVILGGVVSTVAVVLFRELKARITRAESLNDAMVQAFDDLGPATKHSADVSQAALDELRAAFSRRRGD